MGGTRLAQLLLDTHIWIWSVVALDNLSPPIRKALGAPRPADRFVVATAQVHGLTLVTVDKRLLVSREYSTLANKTRHKERNKMK